MSWFITFKSESWNWVRSSRFPAPVRPKGHMNQIPCSIILLSFQTWSALWALFSSVVSCKGWILLYLHAGLFWKTTKVLGDHKAELCWSKACAVFSSRKGEDEDGESGSDPQTGKASLVQRGGSEKGTCKFKGPEDDVKSPKTGF